MSRSTLLKAIAGPVIALYFCMLCPPEAQSQSPVWQFMANYVAASSSVNSYSAYPTAVGTFAACDNYNYTYTWSNGTSNQLKLVSFTANSKSYVVSGAAGVSVKLRRVNNANVSGNRHIIYSETTASSANSCVSPRELDFKTPYSNDMATLLNNNVLNQGTDNLFTNDANGDENNNNIERVDVVFTSGISSVYPADAGFLLCERGTNNAHDGFRIAAILSINASNNPTSFGPAKTCVAGNGSNNGSWGHPSIANGNKLLAAYVLRKDAGDTYMRVSSNVNQELGGVFFSLTDLGVSAGQRIYGYALIGPDGTANPTSSQLLNTSDASVYPLTTTEAGGGGLDLISINTFYATTQALASSSITSFTGNVQYSEAILNWSLNNITDGTTIKLERSENAVSFSPVYSYQYESIANKYYRDSPGSGIFYYRLVYETATGAKVYSSVIKLKIDQSLSRARIYPTLTRPGEIITADNIADGMYNVRLQNASSAIIFSGALTARNGKGTIALPQKQLAPGIYFLVIEKSNGQSFGTEKIIIQP